jgi:hypothetical protein
MTVLHPAKKRRRMAAWAAAAGLFALGTASCAGNTDDHAARTNVSSSIDGSDPRALSEQPNKSLAQLRGPDSLVLTLRSAHQDAGGFLTIRGDLKNDGTSTTVVPAELRGSELDVVKAGQSFGGATLVDSMEKKRYYVLRDTDGQPLTTTGLSLIKAGASVPVFMQFPAPPATTTEVGFQLPQFATADIRISR